MLACRFMLKAFINFSFYSSPVIMKIHSYFLHIGKRKASQSLDVKTDDNNVFCFA